MCQGLRADQATLFQRAALRYRDVLTPARRAQAALDSANYARFWQAVPTLPYAAPRLVELFSERFAARGLLRLCSAFSAFDADAAERILGPSSSRYPPQKSVAGGRRNNVYRL